ncbi:YodL domain-containing protein [Litchfieldia salsa]|nr:YodL domain-containing protein [Litchfieldia salsa]
MIVKEYDITLFQAPSFHQRKGYRAIYRLTIKAESHKDCLQTVFSKFNVPDRIPSDFKGRFIATGDIIYIDEGLRGQNYYQLQPGGWNLINRIHIR